MSNANDRMKAQGSVSENSKSLNERQRSACADKNDDQVIEDNFIGCSAAFDSILETIKTIAARKCSIIISGETGTGKELVARKIHENSDRYENTFVPVDCTTLTGQLFESQLFGHVKGAFTGAIDNTLGFFRAADKGTIFLDEISEIPHELQAKLLRVLQEGVVTPVGSTQSYPVNVRILCATNRDLRKMVHDNEFRSDLYYRLNVVNLEVPPLRERKDDIVLLAEYFLRNQSVFYDEPLKKISDKTQNILTNYYWPGNVRELSNAMERAYVLSTGKAVEPSALPSDIIMCEYATMPNSPLPTLDEAKRKLISEALKLTGGKKLAAAQILNVERRQLNRMIEKLNISVEAIKTDS